LKAGQRFMGCRHWIGAIAISKVSTMNKFNLGSLCGLDDSQGDALGLALLQTSIAMPSIDLAHRGALAIWSRAKGTSTDITAQSVIGPSAP
jgi:hypothetical protein